MGYVLLWDFRVLMSFFRSVCILVLVIVNEEGYAERGVRKEGEGYLVFLLVLFIELRG